MTSRRTAPVRGWFVLLAVLLGAAAWGAATLFLRTCEPVIHRVRVGMHGDAVYDPLLACELMLTRLGYPTHEVRGSAELPPIDHVLVMVNRLAEVSSLRAAEQLAWVARGGRLVVVPSKGVDREHPDVLLRSLGVQVVDDSQSCACDVLRLPLAPVKAAATVQPWSAAHLVDTRHAARLALPDRRHAFVLIVPHGRGEVTVVSDLAALDNDDIGKLDHAAFALWLVLGRVEPAGVVISLYDEMPSLGRLLALHAWTLLLPAALLAAALVWRAAVRFGPLLAEPPAGRRSLLEHLEASGRWIWRSDHGVERRALIEPLRRRVAARIEARQPGWAQLPGWELVQRLAAAAELAPAEVAEALSGPVITDEASFLAAVQVLARVRRSL